MDIEKFIWNEDDFDRMGWHDSCIYSFILNVAEFKLVIDLDYILKWVNPTGNEIYFKFWVAPTTLVFREVTDLSIDLEGKAEIEIEDIFMKSLENGNQAIYDCQIKTNNGSICFKSIGYNQFIREYPIMINRQNIGLEDRGGISFVETVPN